VRLSDPAPGIAAPRGFYRHGATVLHILKQDAVGGPTGLTTAVVEHQHNAAPAPLDVGQELVIFARWWEPDTRAFSGIGTDCCNNPEIVFSVQNGRIQTAPAELSRYIGMRIDAFLDELRALSRRQKIAKRSHEPIDRRCSSAEWPTVSAARYPDHETYSARA
jgi:hypothetical protein